MVSLLKLLMARPTARKRALTKVGVPNSYTVMVNTKLPFIWSKRKTDTRPRILWCRGVIIKLGQKFKSLPMGEFLSKSIVRKQVGFFINVSMKFFEEFSSFF